MDTKGMTILGRWYWRALYFATFIAFAGVAFAGPTARNYVGLSDAAGNNVTMTAGNVPISGTVSITAAIDPCSSMAIAKSSTFIEMSTATTVELVAAVAGKVVYVCGFSVSLTGTGPAFKLVRGTKTTTACDTGAADLTGPYAPTSGSMIVSASGNGTQVSTPASNELCGSAGGTTPSVQGYVSYVQQ